ncbi:MAG: 16S rRNA (cytidine(1402)-2'-O)-methyltransferase [Spirochaetes bacterium]|nr:16S rRNA (cytidine(1402)-2'-O)-methyltransferase [Spirochaetota bacterium]
MSDFYIVATPIGNYKDITFRAQEILQKVDFIACESEKEYDRLFGALRIPKKKFVVCSRDNEREAMEISYDLLKKGESGALISDCGTPLFEDPGFELLSFLRKKNIKIITIPGVNSIITALTLAPFKVKDFYFAGFISQKREIREKEIDLLLKRRETIILMESPYRLKNILELLRNRLKNRAVFVSYNLTQTDETLFYGDIAKVEKEISMKNINKGEYLIIIEALR